jgi:hypothetical protein
MNTTKNCTPTTPMFIAALATVLFFTATPAYAYIDPGTGGILTQLVTGGVAGVLIVLRLYWSRIKAIFTAPRTPGEPAESAERPSRTARPNGPL